MRRWLTRNVVLLSAVSLAQDAASELLYPLMPILLTSVLGAPAVVVGAIEGVAEGVAAILRYLSGRLCDRVGRKPAIVLGYGLAAVGKLLIAAAGIWPVVLAGRVVDRIGKGMRGTPRDALLVHDVDAADLGKVFGIHRVADNLGAVIGPALGLVVLLGARENLRVALWVAVIPALLSVGLTTIVRERPRQPSQPDTRGDVTGPGNGTGAQPAAPARVQQLPGRVRSLSVVLACIALVNFPDALLLLHLDELGYSATAVLLIYMLYNAAMTLIAFPAGLLSDRLPKSRVYAVGLACFAVGYLGLGFLPAGPMLIAAFFVYGGFVGITDGVGKAWISALAPADVRGHAQGLLQGLNGGAILIAGIWAGLLWDAGAGQGRVPLLVSGTVSAVGAVVLLVIGRHWDASVERS